MVAKSDLTRSAALRAAAFAASYGEPGARTKDKGSAFAALRRDRYRRLSSNQSTGDQK
jgi:hypothetical protein